MTIEHQPQQATAQDPISAVEPPAPAVAPEREGPDPALFANRELSWMDFNDRVLQLAEDPRQPLLERVKFAAIWTSNLDEFYMVRVAGLHDQVEAGVREPLDDRRSPSQTIDGIRELAVEQFERVHELLERSLRPELAEHGISIVGLDDVSAEDRAALQERYRRQIYPVLTPLAVGLGRPFPYISNLSLSLAVLVRDPTTSQTTFARVKVPKEMLPRFVPVEGAEGHVFVPLEDLIATNLPDLFPGMEILDHGYFRVTRDADLEVSDEADDLLRAVEAELRRRRFGEAVRVEVEAGMDPDLRSQLTEALERRGAPGLRHPRPHRPQRPLADRQAAGSPGAARRAVVAGDAAAPAAGGGLGHVRGDPPRGHPRPPPLRLVLDLRRALRGAGGGGPRRPRDQDDRVPDVRRHAAHPGADPGDGERQAGRVPRGAQGALRRAGEHRLGEGAGGGGRPRRLRPPVAEDPRQGDPRRPARGRRRAPLRARRDRQLQPQHGAPVHRLRPLHGRPAARRRRGRHVQLPHRVRAAAPVQQGAAGPDVPARLAPRRDRADDRGARARRATPASS